MKYELNTNSETRYSPNGLHLNVLKSSGESMKYQRIFKRYMEIFKFTVCPTGFSPSDVHIVYINKKALKSAILRGIQYNV